MNTQDELLRVLVNKSFGIACNANDFFSYATAEMVIVDPSDLEWVIPIYGKYGDDGLNACLSYIAKLKPINHWQTDKFNQAYSEIETLNPHVASEH